MSTGKQTSGHMVKKKKHKKSNQPKQDDVSLEEIVNLGGDKSDLELIQGVDEGTEDLDYKEDFEADPVNKDELRDFIKELGLNQYSTVTLNDDGEIPEEVREDKEDLSKTAGSKEQEKSAKAEKNKAKKTDQLEVTGTKKQEKAEIVSEEPAVNKNKSKRNKYKVQHEEISTTTPTKDLEQNFAGYMAKYQPRKHLLIQPGGRWVLQRFESDPAEFDEMSSEVVLKFRQFAAQLYNDEVALYKKQEESKKKSDSKWLKTVLVSGTLTDKIAALTLLVQETPLHNLHSIDTLITMVKKKGRRECFMALDSLRELLLSELLLDKGKLKSFEEHPLTKLDEITSGNKDARDRRLLVWYFEDQLKEKYADLVKTLETLAYDNLPATKQKALTSVYELLSEKAEQEKPLLTILVNKLGDPDHKIASKCAHYLTKLVTRHPNMKLVILLEVERVLYRPNISTKAQYYGVCFLNQFILNHQDFDLAARLITIYFSFFKVFLKKGEVDGKMLNALLTGVNRAYPYAKANREKIEDQIGTLYKVVHMVNFNISIQALMLLYQVTDSSDSSSDRYYAALYRKLLDPGLKSSSKHPMFLNLLYKSMKNDMVSKRVKAFVKRILQICTDQQPTFVCGALFLISEVLKEKPDMMTFKHAGEDSDDDDEEHFEDVKDEDDEIHKETNEEESDNNENSPVSSQSNDTTSTKSASWIHRKNTDKSEHGEYDAYHRNPLYCRAEQECMWELQKLSCHYHPSAALFASMLYQGERISYSGDPLEDFTLKRFLDRFVYRNPKKKIQDQQQQSVIQSKHKNYVPKGIRSIPVNSEAYLLKGEASIPADEKYLYKYFSHKAEKTKANAPGDGDSDAESISDNEFDDFLDSYEKQFDGDDNLKFDFASEFSKKKNKSKSDDMEDSEEEDEDVDLSEEEPDFDEEDFGDAFNEDDDGDEAMDDEGKLDFDEEDVEFSDDDEFKEMDFSKSKKKKRQEVDEDEEEDMVAFSSSMKGKSSKKQKTSLADYFAAAEEFGDLMDEDTASKFDMIGTEALSNKDKAHAKQLKWESDRMKWMKGTDWKSKKRGQSQKKGFSHDGKSRKGSFTKQNKSGHAKQKKRK